MKEEFNKIKIGDKEFLLNLKPSPVDERDYIAETIFPPLATELIPDEYDLRKDLLPIRDQGSQGSCAAQTASCMKEWEERKNIGLIEYLSPQFVYNLESNQETEGMYLRDTMKILQKYGICIERYYKYGTIHKPDKIPKKAKKDAENFRILNYARVDTIEGVKKALLKQGPCSIAFPVYNNGDNFWKANQGNSLLGGHATTICGWNRDGFIIRNSWGKGWGDDGYTYYPYEDWGSHWEIRSTIDDKSSEPFDYYFTKDTPKIKIWWYNFKEKFKKWLSNNLGLFIFICFGFVIITTIVIVLATK